jgi:hypothetical protein
VAYPTSIVEIAFTDGPYVVSPTWTDVSSYVYSLTTDRGRSDDWGDFYGAANVTLNNRDRRFDPFYTSGPYYGNLLPRRQIRIRATSGATTYDVFRGFIDGWPPAWTDAGQDSTVTLSCFDAMGLLSSETLPADWSRKYILSTSPKHYWPCDEPITPFTAGGTLKDYGSVPQNMTTTVLASSGSQLAVGLVNSSVQGTGGIAASSTVGAVASVTAFTVSMWAILDPNATNVYGETSDCSWTVGYDATTSKFLVVIESASTGLEWRYTTNQTYEPGVARMITFSFNPYVFFGLYLDGVLVATTGVLTAVTYIPVGDQTNIASAQVQQLIIWASVQTAATIQEIYKYSTVAFSETTAARFNRLIGETSFPSAMTSPPSAPASTVLDITDDAPTVTSELQKVADSEFSQLFVSKAGVLTMYYQTQIRVQTRSTTNQMTIGSGGLPLGQNVRLSYDGDSMRNVANVTMSQGGVFVKKNATSIAARGAAEESLDTQVASVANAESVANIVIDWGGNVYANAEPFEMISQATSDWSTVLDRELNDRITLAVQPPTGNLISIPMLLSRISFEVVPGEWKVFLEGSARWAVAVP